jgi:cyclopropane-fatty-acyl-phospholipid synthase
LYSCGRIEVEGDLVALIESINAAQGMRRGIRSRLRSLVHPPRSNLLSKSPGNIHHHYDIGNDFYRLWLDQQLLYTCAYFPTPSVGLDQAQTDKMDHVCRKLRLQPGESVVEAGCGWGALALHMAREYGVRVRAYNLSREQVAYARQRARSEELDGRVEFVEADYRAIQGQYDVFVSVGMLEHVGRRHYRDLAAVIDRCIGQQGRGLLHSIGADYSAQLNPWIEHRIFPGAYPPTLSEMMEVLEPAGLSVLDVENLRLHYAKTLEHWLARYEAATDRVEAMFGPVFVRAWRLYLAGSLAAFRCGKLQLFQVLFQRHGHTDIPWTRAYLYAAGDEPWKTATS